MLFNSIEFLIFFPLVVWVYFTLPYSRRWIFLLLASCIFYMAWRPEYILLLLASSSVDYFAAIKMGKTEDKKKRRKYLFLSVFCNLAVLFTFKYFNFFMGNFQNAMSVLGLRADLPELQLILPLGISFYTFQALSYAIDVYQGKLKPELNYGRFSLYILFFPQLVAGPIERSTHLMPQFYKNVDFEEGQAVSGLRLMLWGFFQKLVIADNLAKFVDQIYERPEVYGGPALIFAAYFFAYQIYCDFAGYSNIAIGAARILGFDLMKNFDRPYQACSVSEFWRRWHISLSTWFRDYLYIPLGGNRFTLVRWYCNLMVVFVVSGFWHGANWTFVIWGLLHCLFMIAESWIAPVKHRILSLLRLRKDVFWLVSLQKMAVFHLICFAWIFFRSSSLSQAGYIISNLFNFSNWKMPELEFNYYVMVIFAVVLMELLQGAYPVFYNRLKAQPVWLRWAGYSAILWLLFLFGEFGLRQFIYFVF